VDIRTYLIKCSACYKSVASRVACSNTIARCIVPSVCCSGRESDGRERSLGTSSGPQNGCHLLGDAISDGVEEAGSTAAAAADDAGRIYDDDDVLHYNFMA